MRSKTLRRLSEASTLNCGATLRLGFQHSGIQESHCSFVSESKQTTSKSSFTERDDRSNETKSAIADIETGSELNSGSESRSICLPTPPRIVNTPAVTQTVRQLKTSSHRLELEKKRSVRKEINKQVGLEGRVHPNSSAKKALQLWDD